VTNVVNLNQRRRLQAERVEALLGRAPIFTFQPDPSDSDACCSIRVARAGGDAWLGLVRDHSVFAERVRMGMRPTFVVHHDGETPVVCGTADAKLRGRVAVSLPADLTESERDAVEDLRSGAGFSRDDLVIVELRLADVDIDDGEAPLHGAIPRT
jgi:hypothetical protein